MKYIILGSLLILSGCTSTMQCPKPPPLQPMVLDIYDLPTEASNSDKAKAVVISMNQCKTAYQQCNNYLEKYR